MYLLSQKNSEINNTLKEINKAYAQNFNNKNDKIKNEINLSIKNNRNSKNKENEITVNILNKNNELNKYKKVNLSKSKFRNIRNKYLIDNQNNNDNNSINKEQKDKDKKTTTSFIKNIDKSSCNIISKKTSIKSARHKFLFKNNNININNNNSNNFLHLNANISEIRAKGNNKDTHKSSIYQLINKAKDEVQKINEEKFDYNK